VGDRPSNTLKHERGGLAMRVGSYSKPNDDAESRVQQRGRPNRRASHLLNTCKVGSSYVHDDLHNHNHCFKNIYISRLAHVLMCVRPPATRKPVGRPPKRKARTMKDPSSTPVSKKQFQMHDDLQIYLHKTSEIYPVCQ